MCNERGLRDQHFDAPDALPDPDENSDNEERPEGRGTDQRQRSRRRANVRSAKADAEPADELSAKAEVQLGTDERGLGRETFPGRDATLDEDGNVISGPGGVRVRRGSSRPLAISPEQWRLSTAKQKAEAIKSCQAELAAI